jgi:cellulose synthase/poly-beta-1,6-N-acetylglucosamine synthase-like glycosyltransferase
VIIPNYNYGSYVGEAIESALALDWPDVEVIVVDDGSTDHSREVIRAFGDRITAIFQANATQRVACNVGYARSTGDAVLFLDSDDRVAASLANEVAAVWRPGLSKVQVQMMRIDAAGRPLTSVFPAYRPMPTPLKIRDWAARTTAYPTPPGSGNIYARAFLDRLFPLDASCGDAPDSACLAAAPFGGEVETIAKPLVDYRVHGANDSHLMTDPTRFAREIRRAEARCAFSQRFQGRPAPEAAIDARSLILKSLPVLQFRVASLKLSPGAHPLDGDSWFRALLDAVRVPWCFPAATRKLRLAVSAWAVLTLLMPTTLARKLIAARYGR